MQQISAKDSVPFNEGYTLGEQHRMGELKAAYYVAYTNKDMRRYTIYTNTSVFSIICALISLMALLFSIFYWFGLLHLSGNFYTLLLVFYTLLLVFDSSIMIYNHRVQNKWWNRPLIGPRTRHLRVYIYQEGLIKQTDKRSKIIRWSEIAGVMYIPYLASQAKSGSQQVKTAGIKLQLRNKRTLKINGAIEHVDELAELLKYMRSNYNSITV